jgi:tetratricopeptide (TPR) repeat protein
MDDLLPPGQGGTGDDALVLAGAVADGHQPDWAAVEASARTPEQRRFLSRLKAFSEIAGSYQRAARALVPPRAGDTWGSLRIVEPLGRGTRGAVYRAHDPGLARDVALKLIIPAGGEGAGTDALVHEGQLLARVRHPNVVTVFGAGEFEQRVGIWMELVEGRTLEAELAERGPLPESEIRAIGLDLCGALAAVHGAGVLHRDVKAQNVMRDRHGGRVVLMDLSAGRARTWTDADPAVTLPGTLAGSPLYVAPEVLAGGRATEQSDVYSLGVLLFHLATGDYPVVGRTIADLRRVHDSHAPIAAGLSRLSRRLGHVIAKALARRPADRFASAAAMATALERARPPRADMIAAAAVALVVFGIAAAAQWRAAATLPFDERGWVLVVPFQNQSGDGSLDGLVQPALEHELANSGFVNVVSRARVEDTLAMMRRPADTRLDPSLAREVSLRDGGISAVVTGTINRAGAGITVQAAVVEPASGRTVRSVKVSAVTEREVPSQLQRLAIELRGALGESRSSLRRAEQDLAAVTTPSFEALQLYSRAASLMAGDAWRPAELERQRMDAARELLRRATSVDPQFASAWLLLAHATCPYPRAPCLDEAERALALSTSAAPVERHFIHGYVARRRAYQKGADRQEHLRASARSLEAALQFVPDHSWTLDELGTVYRELGRLDDANRVAEQAASLRPNSVRFGSDLARVQLARRDSPALEATATRVMALLPEEAALNEGDRALDLAWVRTWKVHDAWMRGDANLAYAEARRAEERYAGNRTRQWLYFLITIYNGLGRREDTLRVAGRLPQVEATHQRLAAATAWEDWPAFERELASSALFLDPATSNGFLLARARQTARAERVLAELRRRRYGTWELHDELEGQIRVRQERYLEGVALLAPLTLPEVRPRLYTYELAALAHWRLGDVTSAVALLEPLDAQRFLAVSSPWSVSGWSRCRLLLADIYRDVGRLAEARKVEDDLRRLLSAADADYPLVRRLAER